MAAQAAPGAGVCFSVGQIFPSYEALESQIQNYEQVHFVQLWKRDTRTVQAAQKRMSRPLNDRIKYYEITYCCIHGGKNFKARGEGKRSTS